MATVVAPSTPLPWGTDGFTPIRNWDVDPLFRIWAKDQTFLGAEANGRYIPKLFDYVEDRDYNITYKVVGLTPLWVPIFERLTPKPIADMDSEDLLLGQTDDSFRCYIDKSTMPHRLQVDGRCYVNGRNAVSARVYRGNPINGLQEIVSLVLDQSGMPMGSQIPLQLCKIPNGQNVAQYYVPTAYTTTDIKDGEFMYVVLFDDTGAVLSSKGLRAVVTSFTSSTDISVRGVTGIALEGPLMSTLIPNRLEVPLNLTLNSINLMGVVNYNSGSPIRMTVDGGRFDLLGLNAFVPTQAGQHFTMRLKYNLLQDEVSFTGGAVGAERFITEPIDVVVVDVENQLTVKLYPFPVWVDAQRGYRLRWFLLNLDRNIMYDVTNVVEIGTDSAVFDPLLFGSRQQLTVALDLSKVNTGWRAWRFVQTVSITLLRAGSQIGAGTLWRIGFDPNQSPEFGDNNLIQSKVVNQNLGEISVQSGHTSQANWLNAMYYNTKPLTNPQLEGQTPPAPSHFVLTDGGQNSIKLPVTAWNLKSQVNFVVTQGQTWYLKFVKQGPQSDLVLSVAGVPVQQVTSW